MTGIEPADVAHRRGGRAAATLGPDTAAAKPPSAYRGDIDGLRAVAVLSVTLTHAHIGGFSGGFVGVDMFFVISGYLIYRDLVTRLREGRLSLLEFYGRRMRRTLPALYVVGLATLAGAGLVMMPSDLDALARSLGAALLLVPNIFFLTQSGYFDAAAGTKPLLHTWSLGVEEQFYLLAPLLPFALWRLPIWGRRLAVAILFGFALAGCIAWRHASPAAAFYLMPARVFEFLVGVGLVEGLCPVMRPRWLAEVVTTAALATLAVSISLFTEATPLPGLLTLAPCLATAAIIHVGATQRTLVGALLAQRTVAFIGLISYSLYLWHWPILVLSRGAGLPSTPAILAAQGLVLFVLSVLSWRFVETPFRRPGSIWRRRAPWLIPAAASCLVACSALVVVSNGLPQRFRPEVASVASYYAYRDQKPFREGQCFITSKDQLADYDRAACLKIVPGAVNVLLIGDSQAAQLWSGLRDTWPKLNVLQATASGCRPVIHATGPRRCTEMMRDMLESFIPHNHLDAIVIAGIWQRQDVDPLSDTVLAMQPNIGKIIVVGPMPSYDEPLPTLLAKGMLHNDLDDVSKHLTSYIAVLDEHMQRQTKADGIATYISPYQEMCVEKRCRTFAAPGVPMQFDEVHLTPQGAHVFMAAIRARHPALFGTR